MTMNDPNDLASEQYPSVEVPTGAHRLHVYEMHGEWCVWLNTEVADFDGLCIGLGGTRDVAVAMAVEMLEAAIALLQQPPDSRAATLVSGETRT